MGFVCNGNVGYTFQRETIHVSKDRLALHEHFFFQSRFVREVMTVVGRYIFGQNLFGTGHRDQLETL